MSVTHWLSYLRLFGVDGANLQCFLNYERFLTKKRLFSSEESLKKKCFNSAESIKKMHFPQGSMDVFQESIT